MSDPTEVRFTVAEDAPERIRAMDGNGHVPAPLVGAGILPVPARCPYSRSFSKLTGQYTISLDYEGLTRLMEEVDQLWEVVEDAFPVGERIGNRFAAVMESIDSLRQWTGWGGVPEKYLTETEVAK